MKIEAPMVRVLTAITSSDVEDFYAQLLFSHGWDIEFRALDKESLKYYFTERQGYLFDNQSIGLLLYSEDFLDEMALQEIRNIFPRLLTYNIHGLALERDQVLKNLREFIRTNDRSNSLKNAARPALIRQNGESGPGRRSTRAPAKLITIAGISSGSCCTFLTALLAQTMGEKNKVTVLESDLDKFRVTNYLDLSQNNSRRKSSVFQISDLPIAPGEKLGELLPQSNSAIFLLDLGGISDLNGIEQDRRWRGLLATEALSLSDSVIYCTDFRPKSLERLELFLESIKFSPIKNKLLVVGTPIGNKNSQRAQRKAFLQVVEPYLYFLLPRIEECADRYPFPEALRANTKKELEKLILMLG